MNYITTEVIASQSHEGDNKFQMVHPRKWTYASQYKEDEFWPILINNENCLKQFETPNRFQILQMDVDFEEKKVYVDSILKQSRRNFKKM